MIVITAIHEEPAVDMAIQEAFKKLGSGRPSQDQAHVARNFVLGNDIYLRVAASRCVMLLCRTCVSDTLITTHDTKYHST